MQFVVPLFTHPSMKGNERNRPDLFDLRDILAAIGLLSRLPVRVDADHAMARAAFATWSYPIVGLVIGGLQATLAAMLIWLGVPVPLVAGLILATGMILTGALHEDGLADCADGFWGGYTIERRLEIMKDSQIGSYGTLALIMSTGLRWAALWLALTAFGPLFVVATAALSRVGMVALMYALPNARPSGLAASVGKPEPIHVGAAALIGIVMTILFAPSPIMMMIAAGLVTCAVALIAMRKINGTTGDVLGATQQLTEISLLIVLAS